MTIDEAREAVKRELMKRDIYIDHKRYAGLNQALRQLEVAAQNLASEQTRPRRLMRITNAGAEELVAEVTRCKGPYEFTTMLLVAEILRRLPEPVDPRAELLRDLKAGVLGLRDRSPFVRRSVNGTIDEVVAILWPELVPVDNPPEA